MSAERKALFMCAAHCQGGHSGAGHAAAEALGVPFPITMEAMVKKARSEGENPASLWPWMIGMAGERFFTRAEVAALSADTGSREG